MEAKIKRTKDYFIEVVIPDPEKPWKFFRKQKYHWRVRALNGKIIQSGETQHNLNDVRDGANNFGLACGLTVYEVYE